MAAAFARAGRARADGRDAGALIGLGAAMALGSIPVLGRWPILPVPRTAVEWAPLIGLVAAAMTAVVLQWSARAAVGAAAISGAAAILVLRPPGSSGVIDLTAVAPWCAAAAGSALIVGRAARPEAPRGGPAVSGPTAPDDAWWSIALGVMLVLSAPAILVVSSSAKLAGMVLVLAGGWSGLLLGRAVPGRPLRPGAAGPVAAALYQCLWGVAWLTSIQPPAAGFVLGALAPGAMVLGTTGRLARARGSTRTIIVTGWMLVLLGAVLLRYGPAYLRSVQGLW